MRISIELPFHIKNALSNISKLRDRVDLVISVSDARAPHTTSVLQDAEKTFRGIEILSIYNKLDMSTNPPHNSFNFLDQRSRKKILGLIKESLKEKRDKYSSFDYSPQYQILIIGMPNVGKSTLINLLRLKKVSISQNIPGVTRKVTKYYIGNNFWLYDSPGIFFKRSNSMEMNNKLFLLNLIPNFSGDYSDILEYAYIYLSKHLPNLLFGWVNETADDYSSFLNALAIKFNLKGKGDVLDPEKAQVKFLDLIRKSKIFWDYEQ